MQACMIVAQVRANPELNWRKKARMIDTANRTMNLDDVMHEFRASGALLEGHFKLSSGRHSGHYLQCARVLMNPARAARIAEGVCAAIPGNLLEKVDVVVSPAMGGIIIGHEVARVLGKDALFLERPDGVFHLRRGFAIEPGARVLMVEDVVTTGLSSREAIAAVAREGGTVIAECSIIDRSAGTVDLGVPFYPLVAFDFPTYDEADLPPELAAIPVTKPGSRKA
jgi:orotate phosphoribosyltransferase